MVRRVLSLAFAFLLAMPWPASHAADATADPAARQIELFYVALVDTMKKGSELGLQGRYKQLTPIAEDIFDLAAMARLSVGPAWLSMSQTDQKAIVDAFARMTVASYAKNFSSFGGEQFLVDPTVKTRNEDRIVESKLVNSDRSTIPFNYRMHLAGDKWKIIDVYLNGYVSQLALRRSDFSATVTSLGAAGLIKKINELVEKQMGGG